MLRKVFPTTALSAQFAGSVGLVSFGYWGLRPAQKLELGIIYGNTPMTFGGQLHKDSLKLIYNPFHVSFSPRLRFDPVQASFFFTNWWGENLHSSWSSRYPKGYYWWQSSLRKHIALSTQFNYIINRNKLDRLAIYFEANTNDLYLVYDYLPNMESRSFYSTVFYGVGCKLYFF
jgi:hypothetical protein